MMAYFHAWQCLSCGCIHGWIDHPLVTKVERHHRMSMEDVWWCPRCGVRHRTSDGSLLGQPSKQWKELYSEEEAQEAVDELLTRRLMRGPHGYDYFGG